MEAFRGELDLTDDDRREVFSGILKGSSDITQTILEDLCEGYGTTLLTILDRRLMRGECIDAFPSPPEEHGGEGWRVSINTDDDRGLTITSLGFVNEEDADEFIRYMLGEA
jgi:hypothetical protein